jgi:hypothetical protein
LAGRGTIECSRGRAVEGLSHPKQKKAGKTRSPEPFGRGSVGRRLTSARRCAASVWPGHPQRSCWRHRPLGKRLRSSSQQQAPSVSSKFSISWSGEMRLPLRHRQINEQRPIHRAAAVHQGMGIAEGPRPHAAGWQRLGDAKSERFPRLTHHVTIIGQTAVSTRERLRPTNASPASNSNRPNRSSSGIDIPPGNCTSEEHRRLVGSGITGGNQANSARSLSRR